MGQVPANFGPNAITIILVELARPVGTEDLQKHGWQKVHWVHVPNAMLAIVNEAQTL